jgi:uncharacterized protein YaaW (UPF0174 family)
MKKETIQARIDTISDEADKKYREVAEVYRREVLIPFCKKYNLNYNSDEMIYFEHSDYYSHIYRSLLKSPLCRDDMKEELEFLMKMPRGFINDLKQVHSVLHLEVTGSFDFGHYIDNISFKKES